MRRILVLLLLIIIIVSLNWFAEANAGDLESLTIEEKQALVRHMDGHGSVETAPLYDSAVSPGVPALHLLDTQTVVSSTDLSRDLASASADQLVEFDQLMPFGHSLFASPAGERVPPNDIASSSDYILGPGDNIVIYLWGRVENEYNLTVDREGKLMIPKIGELSAWGMTLEEFRTHARQKFSSVYSEFSLTVSLGKIRSIRIYLTGEVVRPGAYTVSSLTSLFNALYLAGGPNHNGSMRWIRLMRNGKSIGEVDLYKFLLEGDNTLDVRLESGDAIFVPVVGSRVAVRGYIRRPAVYELLSGETVESLLSLAGNALAEAYMDRVMLERVADRDEWEVIDLELSGKTEDLHRPLMDGDRVTIYSIFESKQNMVALYGHVKHPGYFERNDSTTISTLVSAAKLQPFDVYYDRANLFRRHSDWRTEVIPIDLRLCLNGDPEHDLLLEDRDSLHIYSLEEIGWQKTVNIGGEVKRPGTYPLYDKMTAADLIFLAGSSMRSASPLQVEIARIDSSGTVSLEYVPLDEAPLRSTHLTEGDRLYVRRLPEYQLHRTVTIEGEVSYPGEYVLSSRNETLYQLIQRSGGFTATAFPTGLVLDRSSIDDNLERLRIPQQLERTEHLSEDTAGNLVRESLVEYESNLVNRIILDMDKVVESGGVTGDVTLEPGDRVYVPTIPSGITVMGAVGSNGTIQFVGGQNVKYYVMRAGNFTPQADRKHTRLIKASGEVLSSNSTMKKHVNIGDVIVVPTKIERERNWAKTFTTILTTTTGVLTSILLINKL